MENENTSPFEVAMLIYPGMTLIDFAGPQNVLGMVGKTHLVWKTLDPIITDTGVPIVPTATFETCPREVDVLFVPGAVDNFQFLSDEAVLDFLRRIGANAKYVTSVCTGSLILGAAGLLDGKRAASHWAYLDILRDLGVEATGARVTRDGNRLTGGGATAGIDFGLTLLAELSGEPTARMIQLAMQYSPEPPYRSGHPDEASAETMQMVDSFLVDILKKGRSAAQQAKRERDAVTS